MRKNVSLTEKQKEKIEELWIDAAVKNRKGISDSEWIEKKNRNPKNKSCQTNRRVKTKKIWT